MATQYIAQQPIAHSGTNYSVGDVMDIQPHHAKFLMLLGWVTEEEVPDAPPAQQSNQEIGEGSEGESSEGTGSADTGSDDAGSDDAGSDDAGSDDTGSDDAGSDDAGSDDAGSDDAGSDDAGSEESNQYTGWLKAQLNDELDARGIEHDATATNAVLTDLLIADDNANALTADIQG